MAEQIPKCDSHPGGWPKPAWSEAAQSPAEAHGDPVDLDADADGYFEEQKIRDLARAFSGENHYAIGGRWEWSKFTPDQIVSLVRACQVSQAQPKSTDAEAQEWNYVIECRDGFVPNVKGPFNKQFTESTLREFAAMRPSYLMVVRSTGWPEVQSGVEWIDMCGGKRRGRLAVQAPAPAPDHVPVSPEHAAKIDAAVGLVLLPPIRVDTETYAVIEKLSKANGMIVQATVRDMICGACHATGETPAPAVGAEPVAWMFQHDETGRNCFCANDGVNTVASFVAANPRLAYVCALYTAHPTARIEEVGNV